jgi:integrase
MPNMTTPAKHSKTGVYYFRKAIPHDVREYFGGKRELKVSLGTKELSQAKRLIGQHIKDAEERISLARSTLAGGTNLTKQDLAFMADTWLRDTIADVDAQEAYSEYVHRHKSLDESTGRSYTDYVTSMDVVDFSLATDNTKAKFFKTLIDKLLLTQSVALPYESESYRDLARMFTDRFMELEKICILRLEDDYATQPKLPELTKRSPIPTTARGQSSVKTPLLSVIFEDFKRERCQIDPSGSALKTMDETATQLNRFISAFGDLPIGEVTKQDAREFRLLLTRLPKSQRKEIKRLTVREQAELADKDGMPRLSTASVRKNMRLISPLFTYAKELDVIDANPIDGMRFSKGRLGLARIERDYSPAEIEKIFTHRAFSDPRYVSPHGRACYWVPVLAYYTGARVQELTQLLTSDVKLKDDIHYLVITTDEGNTKSVKNSASHREIPLHRHLISLGFLEFVAGQKGSKSIFPQLTLDKYGKNSHSLSRWFGVFLKEEAGLQRDDIQQFHAFRHTLKTMMRNLEVPEDVSDFITGHSDGNTSRTYGGCSLETKQGYIDKVKELPISRLK